MRYSAPAGQAFRQALAGKLPDEEAPICLGVKKRIKTTINDIPAAMQGLQFSVGVKEYN